MHIFVVKEGIENTVSVEEKWTAQKRNPQHSPEHLEATPSLGHP